MIGDVVFVPDPMGFKILESPEGPVGKWLRKTAKQVEGRAKQLAPVDTGALQESIDTRFAEDSEGQFADIGSDILYAPFQELGTIHHDAQPYLRPALIEVWGNEGLDTSGSGLVADFDRTGEQIDARSSGE